MANKAINELPAAESISPSALMVIYQDAATQRITGAQVIQLANVEVYGAAQEAKNAAEAAASSASDAQAAAQAVQDLGVSAQTVPAGKPAVVEKQISETGVVTLLFSIPQGEQGIQGEQGVSVTAAEVLEDGTLQLTLSSGSTLNAGSVIGPQGEQGIQGPQGPQGVSIQSIQRTGGTGDPGTTDTYTISLTDGSSYEFQVYNGADGAGTGDFLSDGSVPMSGPLQMGGNRVTGVGEPTEDTDAARLAEVKEKLDKPTGAAGQFLGFTAENVVGAVDAPEGGGATQKDFLIFSGWTTSEYTIRDSFFELGGYTYIVGPSAMNQSFFDVYENLGLSAYDISKNGELKLTCKGPPPAQIGLTVIKIKTGYTTSKAYCINHFWIDVDEILTSVVPKSKILVSAKSYIPNGRMLGDVDGDGQITAEDAKLINKAAVGSVELTPIQIQCADIDGDSSITTSDSYYINKVLNGSSKIGEYFRDILNNWSVNPDYETDEAQFYIDIPVSGLTASSDIALAVQGDEADQIVRVEAMSGAFRVYAKLLPINPLPYMLLENSDSSGTKSFSVTLSASDWSGNQLNKLDDSWPDMTDKSVIASPAPGSLVAAAASGVYCSDAEKQSLTFTCSTLPEEDIVYNISVLGG